MKKILSLIIGCLILITTHANASCSCDLFSSNITNETCNNSDGAIDITFAGGTPPYTYDWDGPGFFNQTTEDLSDVRAGFYAVAITDAEGNVCVQGFNLSNEIVCETIVTNSSCEEGGAIDLTCSGGVPPYSYNWKLFAGDLTESTEDLDGLIPGSYSLTVTDANGCERRKSVHIEGISVGICDTFFITPTPVWVGNQIRLDIVASGFDDLTSMQYSMQYDPAVLQFENIDNFNSEMNISELYFGFGTNLEECNGEGLVTFSWFDISGLSIADGSTMYSIFFTPLSSADSEIYFGVDYPTPVEIVNSSITYLYLDAPPTTIVVEGNVLSGHIYKDENNNCQNDGEQPLPFWPLHITNGTDEWNVVTNEDGFYSIVIPDGTFEVNLTPLNENWGFCNNNISIEVSEFVTQDFGAVAVVDCPALEVDIAFPFIARCFDNLLYVDYCNYGTVEATDAYIEIELDPEMTFVSSEITPTSINGNVVTFDIGNVAIGTCGEFSVTILLDEGCDSSALGQTHCTKATIFPNAACLVDPNWSGASLAVNGTCDGTQVNFVIENVGSSDMNEAATYLIFEDDFTYQSSVTEIILAAGEAMSISLPANGSTYYIAVEQVANHPGNSSPAVAVEGCGTNANGEISQGFVTQHGQDDQDGYVDIECVQNVGSYDPNDKAASIMGYGEEHYIYANTPMEYKIRFQNVGTFTAFNIVVEDELSPNFDITSLRLGASSHDYTFSIVDERKMVFTFDNINLPDSTTDLTGSNGFLTYKVDQLLDLPEETLLENTAAIFFDFNEPVITNTTTHTVGFIAFTTSTSFDNELNIENAIEVYPNPATENITFELDQTEANLSLEIFDLAGKLIMTKQFDQEKIILSKDGLTEGMYFYSINQNAKQLTSGKFIFL